MASYKHWVAQYYNAKVKMMIFELEDLIFDE